MTVDATALRSAETERRWDNAQLASMSSAVPKAPQLGWLSHRRAQHKIPRWMSLAWMGAMTSPRFERSGPFMNCKRIRW